MKKIQFVLMALLLAPLFCFLALSMAAGVSNRSSRILPVDYPVTSYSPAPADPDSLVTPLAAAVIAPSFSFNLADYPLLQSLAVSSDYAELVTDILLWDGTLSIGDQSLSYHLPSPEKTGGIHQADSPSRHIPSSPAGSVSTSFSDSLEMLPSHSIFSFSRLVTNSRQIPEPAILFYFGTVLFTLASYQRKRRRQP